MYDSVPKTDVTFACPEPGLLGSLPSLAKNTSDTGDGACRASTVSVTYAGEAEAERELG